MSTNPPFHDQYVAAYGVSPQEALSQGRVMLNGKGYSHSEFQDLVAQSAGQSSGALGGQFMTHMLDSSREDLQRVLETPHEQHVQNAMKLYRSGPSRMTGYRDNPHTHAAAILALHKELLTAGQPNDVPLYRGSAGTRSPSLDLPTTGLLSFSENKDVAKDFASYARKTKGSGAVYTAQPGEALGLSMDQYGKSAIYKGKGEQEWLVHHLSTQFNPKRPPK